MKQRGLRAGCGVLQHSMSYVVSIYRIIDASIRSGPHPILSGNWTIDALTRALDVKPKDSWSRTLTAYARPTGEMSEKFTKTTSLLSFVPPEYAPFGLSYNAGKLIFTQRGDVPVA